jgi:hypothetical protein
MRKLVAVLAIAFITTGSSLWAKGSHGGSHHGSHTTTTHSKKSTPTTTTGSTNPKTVHVHGYVKKDGTYVAPHDRTAPNKRKNDNWSTRGNVNPETGKPGTKPRDEDAKAPQPQRPSNHH